MAKIRGALKQANSGEWLHDVGELHVQVRLSLWNDPTTKQQNEGKDQPIMISNVVMPATGQGFPNAVICDSGSNIEFIIKSRGPRGFGYSVRSGQEAIAEALYFCDTSADTSKADQVLTLPWFYNAAKQYQNIRVDDWVTLGVNENKELRENYWYCKILSWPIYGFQKDGTVYGTARGEVEVDVKGAGVSSGDPVRGKMSTVSRINEPSAREQSNNGYLTMNFFVFKDKKAKSDFYETYKVGGSESFT